MKTTKYEEDINSLVVKGDEMYKGLIYELRDEKDSVYKSLSKQDKELFKNFSFSDKYHAWYNESLRLIVQLMPERLEDFKDYYKCKRKLLTFETYTISDYLGDISLGDHLMWNQVTTEMGKNPAVVKFRQQLDIVKSLKERFNSSLYDIKSLLQADLFNNELDGAKELLKNGFTRAAGAICGVVLEKHLKDICDLRGLKLTKKCPHISDYNDVLHNNNIIDVAEFRRIQLAGDLRNQCDHSKEKEPTKDDIEELISTTAKIIANVF